jgi:hypothetical protein
MTNITLEDTWNTPLSPSLTKLLIYDFFKQNNIEEIEESEGDLIVGQYSSEYQSESFFKSTLIKKSELPVKILITIENFERETRIGFKMEDLFKGSGIGIKRKYKNLFGKLTNQLKITLFKKERQREELSICPNCNARGFENSNQKICEKCGFELEES